VTIEVTSDTLRLLGATPNSGFTVSETELSQTRIDIEFTSDDHESKFRAELKDGVLDTDVEEEGD
jgi:HSP20 family molecular chaperone IbpA